MPVNEALQAIIKDFSSDNLVQFFRQKTRTFRQIAESASTYDSDFFSNGLLLGEIKLDKSDEIVIYTFRTSKELSERSGKKAQYELAKNILKQDQRYSAGFFIFYDIKNNFRFSLVYDTPLPSGKREWSNFKRFTYYVSKDQTNKTFLYRLEAANFFSLENIKETFSVEKVTKEFYTEIANWYFWAIDNVEFPDDIDKDREQRNAKNLIRLITRIIFIWFMKEKKLVPQSLFDKNIIDTILNYNDKTGSTYYKAILQNLFFATLNTQMKKDSNNSRIFIEEAERLGFTNDGYLQQGYYRYSRFIRNKNLFFDLFSNVPFLNGGLFECLDKKIDGEEIRIDCFSNNPKNESRLIIPDKLFFTEDEIDVNLSKHLGSNKKFKVRGLLTILKSYNFTIDENTPVDEDIALDPELLGKVFENLLASYNPETATTARKSTGSYYTPREIVEFIVNESLVEYLRIKLSSFDDVSEYKLRSLFDYNKNDNPFKNESNLTLEIIEAIENFKVLDPACGSGAFPMGILHKLVLALHKLDPNNIIWKKRLLERVPTEIRDETEKSLQNKPLDYIRKLGLIENCIYGVDIQEIAIQISKLRFFISLLVEQEIDDTKENRDVRSLPNLETKFVAANTLIGLAKPAQMNFVVDEVDNLEKQLFKKRKDLFYANSRKEKLLLQKLEKEFRHKLNTALQHNGFQNDVAEKITGWDPFDQNTHADWFDPEWMFAVKDGFDLVIGNPPYHQIQTLSKNDKINLSKQNYKTFSISADIYCLFYEKGFNLVNKYGIISFISSNRFCFTNYGIGLRSYLSKKNIIKLINFNEINVFESANVGSVVTLIRNNVPQNSRIFINDFSGELETSKIDYNGKYVDSIYYVEKPWNFSKSDVQGLKIKIASIGVPFIQWYKLKINRGITTGANNIFIINNTMRDSLIKDDPKSKEILFPILRGANIKRYSIVEPNEYLIFTYTGIKINNYSAIHNYLKEHKKELEEVYEAKNKMKKWYELRKCNYYNNFKQKKLIWTRLSNHNAFAISVNGEFCVDSSSFAIGKDIEYLAAVLNSKVVLFYFKLGSVIWGKDGIKWFGKHFDSIPIPKINTNQQLIIEELVNAIVSSKKQNPIGDTKNLEDQIDLMVYKLYNLTYKEVKIIDPEIEKIISEKEYEKFVKVS